MGGQEELVDRVVTSSGLCGVSWDRPDRENIPVGLCSEAEWLQCQPGLRRPQEMPRGTSTGVRHFFPYTQRGISLPGCRKWTRDMWQRFAGVLFMGLPGKLPGSPGLTSPRAAGRICLNQNCQLGFLCLCPLRPRHWT